MIARAASVAVLLVGAVWLYGADLGRHDLQPDERQLASQSTILATHGGHDSEGRFLPVFVHATGDVWMAPVPVYAGAVVMKLWPGSSNRIRWAAVAWGCLDVLLVYVMAHALFRRETLALMAGLVLLLTPAHFVYSRMVPRDGIWPLPFVLGWLIGLTAFSKAPSTRPRQTLALGAAALAASAYSQPSAAVMVPLFAAISIVSARRAAGWRASDAALASAAFATVLIPLFLWFAMHPRTYVDTFGRWLLHPALIRNPLVWAAVVSNWNSLSVWSDVYWSFFAPSHLFLNGTGAGVAGVFLFPVGVMIGIGVYEILRGSRAGASDNVSRVVLAGFVLAPLAAASFKEPRAIQLALVVLPFGALLATHGVAAAWSRGHYVSRALILLLLVAVPVQFMLCYRRF